MGDREVIVGRVRGFRVMIGERRIGIVDDLTVAVVLHHDDEDMIEMRYATRNLTFVSTNWRRAHQQDHGQAYNCGPFCHSNHLSIDEECQPSGAGIGADSRVASLVAAYYGRMTTALKCVDSGATM